jgi:hypothetical protein
VREPISQIVFLNGKAAEANNCISPLLQIIKPLICTILDILVTTGDGQIVIEIGDVSRFSSDAAIVSLRAQLSNEPVGKVRGYRRAHHHKHVLPYLRRVMWLVTNRVRQHDLIMKVSYDKKFTEGKCHHVAITVVTKKLCCIIYVIMRNQELYDPDR